MTERRLGHILQATKHDVYTWKQILQRKSPEE